MTECPLCRKGDPAIPVRCHNCRGSFHLHKSQLDMAADGDILMADCPSCQVVNCWQKYRGKIKFSGPVFFGFGQSIVDLRRKSKNAR